MTGWRGKKETIISLVGKRLREDEVKRIKRRKRIKSAWWMPRLSEATKDVVSCEKLRGAANER